MTDRLYLDHNATTFTWPNVIEAMTVALEVTGNPTAQHGDGRAANAIVSKAREHVGLAMGVCAQDIVFTSGGTESCNTAIWSAIQAGCKRLLISSMDHPATINAAENFGVDYELIPADDQGRTDMAWLKTCLTEWDAADGTPFIGALYVAPTAPFTPLLAGGGQERRRRSGTHNVAGIAGFGAACETLINLEHTRELRNILEKELKAIEPNIVFFGERAERLPNTTFFAVPDASSMILMMGLDLEGVSVSTGTACSSGKVGESRAIVAMSRSHEAPKGAIRVSFGDNAILNEVEDFISAWMKVRRIKSDTLTPERVASPEDRNTPRDLPGSPTEPRNDRKVG